MTASGSVSAGQEFFAQGAKPPRRFRDRGSAPRMADDGWLAAEALAHAYPFFNQIAVGSVKRSHRFVASPDLEVCFCATSYSEAALRLLKQGGTDASSLVRRPHRDCVEPASVAIVSSHHRSDDVPSFFRYDEQLGLNLEFCRNGNCRLVPRRVGWKHFIPERLNACEVPVFISDNVDHPSS